MSARPGVAVQWYQNPRVIRVGVPTRPRVAVGKCRWLVRSATMAASALFQPGRIGPVTTANRIVRAGTSETAALESGEISDQLVDIYEALSRNRVGLILSGHMFCDAGGRYAERQDDHRH